MKLLSVVIGCYGAFPEYSLRAVRSVLDNCEQRQAFDLHVGLSECCSETSTRLRELYDAGSIDTLIESRANINKDPMMRLLLERTETHYMLWMDDDSHVLPSWDRIIMSFVSERHPFDVAGHVFYSDRSEEYKRFLQQRPWWKGEEHYLEGSHRDRVWFATGGLFIASTAFLREVNFPDRAMVKRQDDLLLGDCLSQNRGRLVDFSNSTEIMSRIRISDGSRRGTGESMDGWRSVHPQIGL